MIGLVDAVREHSQWLSSRGLLFPSKPCWIRLIRSAYAPDELEVLGLVLEEGGSVAVAALH